MKVLFVHNNFPAQFVHMARVLVQQGHDVRFLAEYVSDRTFVEGLQPLQLPVPPIENSTDAARLAYLRCQKRSDVFGNAFMTLRKSGFSPDVIIDHPGWGATLYAADMFPRAARLCYFEWFFTQDTQTHFTGHNFTADPALFATLRQRNLFLLNALHDADWGIVPTQWQCRQIPTNYHYKLQILHDGIDTGYFCPAPDAPRADTPLLLRDTQGTVLADIPAGAEVVTFTTRGLEPSRGFPQWYAALPQVLAARPLCHALIIADDKVCYGDPREDGKGWGQYLRESSPLPENLGRRVHFVDFQPRDVYRAALQRSTVHVYLTVPFVLSWSLLEAMSCGCLVVASDTEPVREVVQHGVQGVLTPWKDAVELGEAVIMALENAPRLQAMREAARQLVVQRYDVGMVLPQQLRILEDVVRRKWGKAGSV